MCVILKYWKAGLPELPHQGTAFFYPVPESRSDRKKMFVVEEICADDACLHDKHVTLSSLLVFLQRFCGRLDT